MQSTFDALKKLVVKRELRINEADEDQAVVLPAGVIDFIIQLQKDAEKIPGFDGETNDNGEVPILTAVLNTLRQTKNELEPDSANKIRAIRQIIESDNFKKSFRIGKVPNLKKYINLLDNLEKVATLLTSKSEFDLCVGVDGADKVDRLERALLRRHMAEATVDLNIEHFSGKSYDEREEYDENKTKKEFIEFGMFFKNTPNKKKLIKASMDSEKEFSKSIENLEKEKSKKNKNQLSLAEDKLYRFPVTQNIIEVTANRIFELKKSLPKKNIFKKDKKETVALKNGIKTFETIMVRDTRQKKQKIPIRKEWKY
jgi:hypothetical protein